MGWMLVESGHRVCDRGMVELPSPLIVAIDDEIDDIFFLRRAVEKTGIAHRFQPFSNGEAAMVALSAAANGDDPAAFPLVCFLDIKMFAMTGFDVLKWIRSQRNLDSLPVIMYSSSDHPEDVQRARELDAQGYLKKYPSVEAMRMVLEEAAEFAAVTPPKKTFLQWHYRFVDSDAAATTVK
jgi:CheY-like chemotaxis protein